MSLGVPSSMPEEFAVQALAFARSYHREVKNERARAWHRERVATEPGYRERLTELESQRLERNPEIRERARLRAAAKRADPEHRERLKARAAERRADPEYREKLKAKARERYANDSEYRERAKARAIENRARSKSTMTQ